MAITKWSQGTLSFRQKHRPTYPPILQSPVPPFQALTYFGLAHRDTGLKLPLEKYGPTGLKITKSRALVGFLTPREGWNIVKVHTTVNLKHRCQSQSLEQIGNISQKPSNDSCSS